MTRLHPWKSGTAALMAMAITTGAVVPMFVSDPARAQTRIAQSRTITIPAGVTFPVTYDKDKVVVTPDETSPLTLKVASDIVDNNNNVLIPAGTEIKGKLKPASINSEKGSQFVAEELRFSSDRKQSLDATSQVITRKETIKKGASTGTVLQDAAIGAGAAAAISLLTGNRKIELLEVLGGGGVGAAASLLLRKKEADVVVINPNQDLDLTLRSDLILDGE